MNLLIDKQLILESLSDFQLARLKEQGEKQKVSKKDNTEKLSKDFKTKEILDAGKSIRLSGINQIKRFKNGKLRKYEADKKRHERAVKEGLSDNTYKIKKENAKKENPAPLPHGVVDFPPKKPTKEIREFGKDVLKKTQAKLREVSKKVVKQQKTGTYKKSHHDIMGSGKVTQAGIFGGGKKR